MKSTALLTLILLHNSSLLFSDEIPLKAHAIFTSNMVLQRDKPIKIWGWADEGDKVKVSLGKEKIEVEAKGDKGLWQAKFPAREASSEPVHLHISSGDEKLEMENIVFGDLWVMNGQSNMAWGLQKTQQADLQILQAHLPMLRQFRISTNEQATMQSDIRESAIANGGWVITTPETAGGHSAIGFAFASQVQRALQIPIGIIDNARGGASIESLVPRRKFSEDPLTKRYEEYVAQREAEFDHRAKALEMWEKDVARAKRKNVPEAKWPKKPKGHENLRSWNIPGMSPSDAGACYNGMFGVFKGLQIKGVLFHQGYNNAMNGNCRPKRYQKLMKLMIEGWREDFEDPDLPVGVIGFCAGGIPQSAENFESWTASGAPYIRESQRLGVSDAGKPEVTTFLPAYDVQIPGLHPQKKKEHGVRAARWALKQIYELPVAWNTATLVSAKPKADEMILTFDHPVMPDNMSTIPKGFSIAGEDGKFYRAHARFRLKKDQGIWATANKTYEASIIHVWSPLVKKPVAVRYGWASTPEGNLKVDGKPWAPLANFRTDAWDFPESEDPAVSAVGRSDGKARNEEASERLTTRLTKEVEMATTIAERLNKLGKNAE